MGDAGPATWLLRLLVCLSNNKELFLKEELLSLPIASSRAFLPSGRWGWRNKYYPAESIHSALAFNRKWDLLMFTCCQVNQNSFSTPGSWERWKLPLHFVAKPTRTVIYKADLWVEKYSPWLQCHGLPVLLLNFHRFSWVNTFEFVACPLINL